MVNCSCYFVFGVNVFEEPPESWPPMMNTPSKYVSVASDTEVTPYINVCDVLVNWGALTSTVPLFTLLGSRYEKSTAPLLSFTLRYLPLVSDTELICA